MSSAAVARGLKKKPRLVTVHSCPAGGGLCKLCEWEGKRVPAPWVELPAGAPYEGSSPLKGKRVKLRGDTVESVVVGLATPLGGSLLQGNRSRAYKCQGSYIVRTPLGSGSIETPVPKSVVRERRRVREGLCPDDTPVSSADVRLGMVRELAREATRRKKHPWDLVAELPFPHRKGGSPCCINSPVNPDKLTAMVEAYAESGEEADFERVRAGLRRALPEPQRSTMMVETRADALAGIKALKDHCWGMWLTVEERAAETSKDYRKRRKLAAEERRAQGLDSGTGLYRRRESAEPAFEGQRAANLAAIVDFKNWRPGGGVELPADFEEVF